MEGAGASLQLQCMAPIPNRRVMMNNNNNNNNSNSTTTSPNMLRMKMKMKTRMRMSQRRRRQRSSSYSVVKCGGGGSGIEGIGGGIGDFIGGDLVKLDLGRWISDVEEHKALAIYSPHEGGYEGRYLNRLIYQGYYFLDLSARGLGDPETTLINIHPVCPVS